MGDDHDDGDLSSSDDELEEEVPVPTTKNYSATFLTAQQVVDRMTDLRREVSAVVGPLGTPTTSTLLLDCNSWDSALVTKSISSNFQEYCSQNGIPLREPGQVPLEEDPEEDPRECELCVETKPAQDFYTQEGCRHSFCVQCWKNYLQNEVTKGRSVRICCPACPYPLDERTVTELVANEQLEAQFRKQLVDNFVEKSRNSAYCPAPDCSSILVYHPVGYEGWKSATCGCGAATCLNCGKPWHGPLSCEGYRQWLLRLDTAEAGNLLWLQINTKPCPKCNTHIEKTGGCNWMTCNKCKYEFCWVCLQKAHEHGFTETCNKFGADDVAKVQASLAPAKETLRRFTFYGERYANMLQGLQFDKKLLPIVEEVGAKHFLTTREMNILREALVQLQRARYSMAYSYATLFLVEGDGHSCDIFERTLEVIYNGMERFAQFLERDLKDSSKQDILLKPAAFIDFIRSQIKALEEEAEKNFSTQIWKFREQQ